MTTSCWAARSEFYNRDSAPLAPGHRDHPERQPHDRALRRLRRLRREQRATGYSYNLASVNPGIAIDDIDADLGLVGLAYTGEFADMITVKGEFSWLFGEADLVDLGGANDSYLSGHNLYLDVAFHNDLMTIGAAFVYGSGDTSSGYGANHYNVNFITADEFVFGNIIASGNGGLNDAFGGGLGFCDDIENLTAAKLYFEIYPLCCDGKLSLNAAVIWAKWTEDVGLGTPYDHPVEYYGTRLYSVRLCLDGTGMGNRLRPELRDHGRPDLQPGNRRPVHRRVV